MTTNTTALRTDEPGLGLGLDAADVDAYLKLAAAGTIVSETGCGAVQDDRALREDTTVALPPAVG